MRTRRPMAALAAVAVLAAACASVDDGALPPLTAPEAREAAPLRSSPPARLCDAIPGEVVVAATGRSPLTVDGAGTQCSWRTPSTHADGDDLVLQGSFIAARSFEVARPDEGATHVPGLGDDAYLVQAADVATTLYVRDGSRAFALWFTEPGAPGDALTRLAAQVLAS